MRLIDANKYMDELKNIYHDMSHENDMDACVNYNRGVNAAEQLLYEQPTFRKVDLLKYERMQWIPVSVRLPEADEHVLYCYRDCVYDEINVGISIVMGWWLREHMRDVVAWMPLPQVF